jgi:CubicO group peptidase (beta-lactamase class C family)
MSTSHRAAAILVAVIVSGTVSLGQAPAPAPVPSTASPAQAATGVSAQRLARIDAMLESYVERGLIPGAVALVLRDGRRVYQKAVGWADKEAGRPMRIDTLFRIASQTKAVTSVAALILVEEGKLSLSDQVGKFIPSFAKTTVSIRNANASSIAPARRPITIRDLLTHTAGISYGGEPHISKEYAARGLGPSAGAGWYFADKNEPICDAMERLGTLPFVAQPGDA